MNIVTLEKIGILQKSTAEFKIKRNDLIRYLAQNTVGNGDDLSMISSPYLYTGQVFETGFSLTETTVLLKKPSDALITGKIHSSSDGIKLELKSKLLGQREYLFLSAGVILILLSCLKAFSSGANSDSLWMILTGVFIIGFTLLYMGIDAKSALDTFERRIHQIEF